MDKTQQSPVKKSLLLINIDPLKYVHIVPIQILRISSEHLVTKDEDYCNPSCAMCCDKLMTEVKSPNKKKHEKALAAYVYTTVVLSDMFNFVFKSGIFHLIKIIQVW